MKDNRTSFLQNPVSAYEMKAEILPNLIARYKAKGIDIRLNGTTKNGEKILKKHEENNRKLIQDLNDDSKKYALYLQKYWRDMMFYKIKDFEISAKESSAFHKHYIALREKISEYLNEYQTSLREDLTPAKLGKLNDICSSPEFKNIFDTQIEKLKIKLAENDECLTVEQAKEEISEIQGTLKDGEIVGYFYTNNHRVEADHFEVLLLSKDTIIKPVEWNADIDKQVRIPSTEIFATADIGDLVYSEKEQKTALFNSTHRIFPRAQAEKTAECGTLGMLYLKELLKRNAEQLKEENSLIIPYYDKSGNLKHFFFPSPQVLRYSHSESYNEIIKAMLTDTEEPIVMQKGDTTHTITTLKATLEKTKEMAKQKGKEKVVQQCEEKLAKLPAFRIHWSDGYNQAKEKRDTMQGTDVNKYLSYSSNRLYKRATGKTRTQADDKPPSSITPQVEKPAEKKSDSSPQPISALKELCNEILKEIIKLSNEPIMDDYKCYDLINPELVLLRRAVKQLETKNDVSAIEDFINDIKNDIKENDLKDPEIIEMYQKITLIAEDTISKATNLKDENVNENSWLTQRMGQAKSSQNNDVLNTKDKSNVEEKSQQQQIENEPSSVALKK